MKDLQAIHEHLANICGDFYDLNSKLVQLEEFLYGPQGQSPANIRVGQTSDPKPAAPGAFAELHERIHSIKAYITEANALLIRINGEK